MTGNNIELFRIVPEKFLFQGMICTQNRIMIQTQPDRILTGQKKMIFLEYDWLKKTINSSYVR